MMWRTIHKTSGDTLKVFESMDRFNPDKTWHSTNDEW